MPDQKSQTIESDGLFVAARSILFLPAARLDLAEKAARSQADAVCLDLEDAVAPGEKQKARDALGPAAAQVTGAGKPVFVRINSELELAGADLAALPASCKAVVLPKAAGLQHIALVCAALDRIAAAGGPDATLIAMIEDAAALVCLTSQAGAIRAPARLSAVFLGTEDLAAEMGSSPASALMRSAFHSLAIAARAMGADLLGFPGSIAEYRDLDLVRRWAAEAKASGAAGAFCIHPAQIGVLNAAFTPAEAELTWARAAVSAFDKARAEGSGVAAHEGRMIDRPVYLRAKRVLSRAGR